MRDEDYDDEVTTFEPTPWGAQQRMLPRRGFKAAVTAISQIIRLPGLPRPSAPPPTPQRTRPMPPPTAAPPIASPFAPPIEDAFAPPSANPFAPPIEDAFAPPSASPFAPPPVDRPQPSFVHVAHTWPMTRRFDVVAVLKRFAFPLTGVFLALVIGVTYLVVPHNVHAHAPALATTLVDSTAEHVITVTNIEPIVEPINEPAVAVPEREPTVAEPAQKPAPRKARKRRPVVVDAATPLGNLRPSKH